MHSHKTLTHRAAFAVTAVVMTATTISLAVVVPAKMGSDQISPRLAEPAAVTLAAATAFVTSPCIDVDGDRAPTVNSVHVRNGSTKRKHQGQAQPI